MSLAWFDVPFPELSPEQMAAIIARHRLHVDVGEIERLPTVGVVNTELALQQTFRPSHTHTHRGRCSRHVHRVGGRSGGTRGGIANSTLLIFDDTRSILDVPYTMYERVHADKFLLVERDLADTRDINLEPGRELAELHRGVGSCEDPNGYLDEPGLEHPQPLIERLARAGMRSSRNVKWLDRIFDRRAPAQRTSGDLRRFLHDVAHPGNMLRSGNDACAALIDCNDAGWGDQALEFVNIAASAAPHALTGYRELCALDQDDGAEMRILWYDLVSALAYLEKPARPDIPGWWPPTAPMIDVLHAVGSRPA